MSVQIEVYANELGRGVATQSITSSMPNVEDAEELPLLQSNSRRAVPNSDGECLTSPLLPFPPFNTT